MANDTQSDAEAALTGASVLELVAKGWSLQRVADHLGFSKATAHRYYHAELRRAVEDNAEVRDMLLHQQLETLRQVLEAWMPRAIDTANAEAAGVVLRVTGQVNKLLGLEAAIQHEVSVRRVDQAVAETLALLDGEGRDMAPPLRRVTEVPVGDE
jgi:hypothetical protein